MKFESVTKTLRPLHAFIFSIVLIIVVILMVIVVYYNAYLTIKGKPPYTVIGICPQIMFPRGIEGLGRHNLEEEG